MKNKVFGDIYHTTLDNGLQVIVNTDHTVPKVSVQLWYNVGSKDEGSGERGLAHLLEHMIFKGTKKLSESDINLITSKLSGYTNAFTSYDYTGYLFDFPKQHWVTALDVLADCMTNCQFNEDMLQSELKAVVQELKLYKDDYSSSLAEAMISNIFSDHPYHHPVIGYKQDLWSITRKGLLAFYHKHYRPHNATLVIVGAVDPQEALREVKTYFGTIASQRDEPKKTYYAKEDVGATSVALYRDVQRPQLMYAWRIPGLIEGDFFLSSVVAYIIGESKNAVLYNRLVDELKLATDVHMFVDDMFEHGVLFLFIDPIDQKAISPIEDEIKKQLVQLCDSGAQDDQIKSAIKQLTTEYLGQTEEFQERAYMIGKSYLAKRDPHYIHNYMQADFADIKKRAGAFISKYMRPTVMHKGAVLPLSKTEKPYWLEMQKENDRTDAIILNRKVRQTEVEPGNYVNQVMVKEPPVFNVPQYKKFVLSNGLTVLHHPFACGDKIEIQLDFDAQYYYDPEQLQGLSNFVFAAMQEGTKKYNKQAFVQALASRGIDCEVSSAHVSMSLLKEELPFALHLLHELLEHALFDKKALEKVRQHVFAQIENFWDAPNEFVGQLVREHMYKNHPYAKSQLGTIESVTRITQKDVLNYYKAHITPVHTRIAIVGVADDNLEHMMESALGSWSGNKRNVLSYPTLAASKAVEIVHPIVRDQVVLAFAGLSVEYKHPLYDALLLFDQIFTGSVQRSMSSHLFQLREQTGLFYSIGGSLVHGAGKQPGLFYIKTMVSQDRLAEAEEAIKKAMEHSIAHFTDEEVIMAKNAVLHQIVDQFATQKNVAGTFLFLEHMGLPRDYFVKRFDTIKSIDRRAIAQAAASIMQLERVSTFKVGRI